MSSRLIIFYIEIRSGGVVEGTDAGFGQIEVFFSDGSFFVAGEAAGVLPYVFPSFGFFFGQFGAEVVIEGVGQAVDEPQHSLLAGGFFGCR